MASTKPRRGEREDSALAFDVTQEIDPSLADQILRSNEPTLTQTDFDDITVVLPEKRKPKP